MRSSVPALLSALLLTTLPAFAGDGRLEINHTCAESTGCFSGDAAGFPVTITSGGSYLLTSDLQVPDENTTAIEVQADEVSVDLNGFSIRGVTRCTDAVPSVCSPVGTGDGVSRVSSTVFGMKVANGTIVGIGNFGVNAGANSIVEGLRISHCGLACVSAGSSIVRDNVVRLSGGYGIATSGTSVVSGNVVYRAAFVGIQVFNATIVTGNSTTGSAGDGIQAFGDVQITDNISRNNGDATDPTLDDGIECGGHCSVHRNIVEGNTGYGLNLASSFSGYRENVIASNAAGSVTGSGRDAGANVINGVVSATP